MNNKEIDGLLKRALEPTASATDQLNQDILKACEKNDEKAVKRNGKKIKTMRFLPRVAAIMLICSLGGAISVYAATHLFRKVNVDDFMITTDNISQEQVNAVKVDMAKFQLEVPEISEKVIKEEKPAEGDLWTEKKVMEHKIGDREYVVEEYLYDDYMKAEEAEGFVHLFKDTEGFKQRGMGAYETRCRISRPADDTTDHVSKALDSEMGFKGGFFHIQYLVNDVEGFMIPSFGEYKFEDKRSYVSESGAEFDLWNYCIGNELSSGEIEYIANFTETVISYGNTNIIIDFYEMDEEQIHMILDKIVY